MEITGEGLFKLGCGGLTRGRPLSSSGTVTADNDDTPLRLISYPAMLHLLPSDAPSPTRRCSIERSQ